MSNEILYERYKAEEPAVVIQSGKMDEIHHPRLRRLVASVGLPFDEFKELLQTPFGDNDELSPVYNDQGDKIEDIQTKTIQTSIGALEVARVNLYRPAVNHGSITSLHLQEGEHRGFEAIYMLSGKATLTFPETVEPTGMDSYVASNDRVNVDLKPGSLAFIPAPTANGWSWVGWKDVSFLYISQPPWNKDIVKPAIDLFPHPLQSEEGYRYVSEGRFTADRDIVDSLKLEVSVTTPAQETAIKEKSLQVEAVFLKKYGQYMPAYKFEEAGGVEDRVLVTNRDNLRDIYTDWGERDDFHDVAGTVYKSGWIEHILYPVEVWNLLPDDNKAVLEEYFSGEPDPKQTAINVIFMNILAHERAHQYQAQQLHKIFFESGARYYSKDIMKELGITSLQDETDRTCVQFYNDLLEKYGNVIHAFFFGTERNWEWFQKIEAEISPELEVKLEGYI